MDVTLIPKISLAIAKLDRIEFYKKLLDQDSVFFIEEERLWIVASHSRVSQFLKNHNLKSNRLSSSKILFQNVKPYLVSNFYNQWLMYKDGTNHNEKRVKFIRANSEMAEVNYKYTANKALSDLHFNVPVEFGQQVFLPYIINCLADYTGLKYETIKLGYNILSPVLHILHGRSENFLDFDFNNLEDNFIQWFEYLELVINETEEKKSGFINNFLFEERNLNSCGIALLPFIDVVDVLVSLCGAISIDVSQHYNVDFDIQKRVLEIIRLFSPFQVCNRLVNGPIEGLNCKLNDRFCLLIGAANRDPRVIKNPNSVNTVGDFNQLSFGLGSHSCLGRQLSLKILVAFYQEISQFHDILIVDDVTYYDEWGFAGIKNIYIRSKDI